MRRLDGRIALITAAGSGMGRASAERFASEGAHVIVSDVNEAAAKEVTQAIVTPAVPPPRLVATSASWIKFSP